MTKEEIVSLCDSIKNLFSIIFFAAYVTTALVAIFLFMAGYNNWFIYLALGSIIGDILTFLFIGGLLR